MTGFIKSIVLLALASVVPAVQPLKLPPYLKACSRSDPNLGECARKSGQEAIPKFIAGDKKYKLPNLNPLEIIQLTVRQGTDQVGLKIQINNAKLYGLKDTIIDKIEVDLDNRQFTWYLTTPAVNIKSAYSISGKILLLPIVGNGRANVTLVQAKYIYNFKYNIVTRHGEEYMAPEKGKMSYTLSHAIIDLENLFNGDKFLGPQMNKFLNENWQEASRELGPSISDALGQVIDEILKGICETVPYKDIFTP